MIGRQVTHILRDSAGNIIALCNPGQPWSPVPIKKVISEIRLEIQKYYVQDSLQRVDIVVALPVSEPFLRTNPVITDVNLLEFLPESTEEIDIRRTKKI